MAGLLADAAEVFQGFDDPRAKEFLPIAVHRNPRGEWLSGHKEPLGQSQAIAGSVRRKFGENSGHIRGKVGTDLIEKVAALEFQRSPLLVGLLFYHHGELDAGNCCQLFLELLETSNTLGAGGILSQTPSKRGQSSARALPFE